MRPLVQALKWGYGLLLRLYPRGYWATFGQERVWVFGLASEEAARSGGLALIRLCLRELGDLPGSILVEHCRTSRRERMNATNDTRQAPSPSPAYERATWLASLAAVAPFLFLGLSATLAALPMPASDTDLLRWVLLVARWLFTLAGLTVGWVKGFPRWSYAFLLSVPLDSWLSGAIRISQTERVGIRSWIPLGIAVLVVVALTRSLHPLRRLVHGVWEDWTQLSFALYSLMPVVVEVMFDEVDDRFELPFMIGLNLVLVGGALAYMRSATPRRRALVLLDALALAWMGSAVGTTVYWHRRRTGQMAMSLDWCTGARPAFIALFVLLAFLLAPALLGLVRRSGGGSRPLQTG